MVISLTSFIILKWREIYTSAVISVIIQSSKKGAHTQFVIICEVVYSRPESSWRLVALLKGIPAVGDEVQESTVHSLLHTLPACTEVWTCDFHYNPKTLQ